MADRSDNSMNKIVIKGAREHNLKNINVELPKNKLIVFTGLSGSGKSSLAFDTIYAEGQRRYVESLSSYARQFLGIMDKPDVDSIEGLSPAISIDQKSTSHNPRSTVGTVTEIYDYLRLLFARIGHPHCPNCGREITKLSIDQIVIGIIDLAGQCLGNSGKKIFRFLVLSPVVRDRKGEFAGLFDNLRAKGFRKVRIDRSFFDIDEDIFLIKTNKHTIDVAIDSMSIDKKTIAFLKSQQSGKNNTSMPDVVLLSRLRDSIEQALNLSDGLVVVGEVNDSGFSIPDKPKNIKDYMFSEKFACPVCNLSIAEIEPRSFSFNSPHGACATCTGLGSLLTVDPALVINPMLSISEGGILPFAKMFFHDTWFSRVITTVCKEHDIDIRQPLKKLTKSQRNVLLDGTGQRLYHVIGTNRFGEQTSIEEQFVGIISELRRRYSESESDFVRREIEKYMTQEVCTSCQGKRLKAQSLTITIDGLSIADITSLSIGDAYIWARDIYRYLHGETEVVIATPIQKEIQDRLGFLEAVGLDYLTLGRSATTLSGGEAQRIRLASQIGSGLSGVLYVLDEPSIGLHQRDNGKLITMLKKLRDLGNTVIVVEHDREMMDAADFIVDFGPEAGEHGGAIVASGNLASIKNNSTSLTGLYLSGKKKILQTYPERVYDSHSNQQLVLSHALTHNLKNITVSFPLGAFICVTGVSGSGKSTLVVDTLYPSLSHHLNRERTMRLGDNVGLTGAEYVDKVILIDQSPIGRTPRSNPATYTGIFSYIRDLFSLLPESRLRGYLPGRFSFNVKGGRCETCEGEGQKKIEMQFLSDVYVTCEVCHGSRYNSETLEVTYHGKSIAQILDMTVGEAKIFFSNHPGLSQKLQTICDVGLEYIHVGQPAPTLSGGEAQRVKLATELSRKATGKTLYILDEPTTGLHFADLEKLLLVLKRLTSMGNTVIVIEHNLDMISHADWIVDLGPEGGEKGGYVVASGTPKDLAKVHDSFTGQFLKKIIK